jgi:hypothetical protein
MNAAHREGAPDPYLCHGTIPTIARPDTQASVPFEVRLAFETIRQIEAYDKSARQHREYYTKDLERSKSHTAEQVVPTRDTRRRP